MFLKNKISFYLLSLLLFLLPWQTRFVYEVGSLNGYWEYGTKSVYATELLLGFVMLVFLIERLRDSTFRARLRSAGRSKATIKRLMEFGLILGYLGFVVGSSVMPGVVVQKLHYLLLAVCLGLIIWSLRAYCLELIASLWLGGVLQGVLALWQFLSQEIVHLPFSGIAPQVATNLGTFVIEFADQRWLRAYGAFGSPNILGGFLAVVWILGLQLYFHLDEEDGGSAGSVATCLPAGRLGWSRFVLSGSQKRSPSVSLKFAWFKIALMIGQLVVLIGLVLSFSRGAWLGALVGTAMCIYVLVREYGWGECKFDVIKILLYSSIIILGLFVMYKPLFVTRVSGEGRLEVKSNETRIGEYREWASVMKDNWWLGTGPGMYTYKLYERNKNLPAFKYQPVHNTFLLLLAEWGLLGILVWGMVLWRVKVFRKNLFYFFASPKQSGGCVGGSLLVTIFVLLIFDHYFWSLPTGMFFGVVAIILAIYPAPLFKERI